MFRFQLSVAERLAHQPVVYSLRHMVQLFSIGRCCLLHDLTGEPFRIAGRRWHHVLGIRRAHRRIVIRSEEVGLSLLGRIVIRLEAASVLACPIRSRRRIAVLAAARAPPRRPTLRRARARRGRAAVRRGYRRIDGPLRRVRGG